MADINNISIKRGNPTDKGINRQPYQQEIAVMCKIVRFPQKPEPFFDSLKNLRRQKKKNGKFLLQIKTRMDIMKNSKF